MKNIHILPTDKPSNLFKDIKNKLMFNKDWIEIPIGRANQNIYITSDEYIGLSYYLDGNLVRKGVVDDKEYWEVRKDYKKIILTTDQDLIKDGVQAIHDTFLEWFVKNPSCEWVEVGYGWIRLAETDNEGYWVSIPDKQFEMQQEELKLINNCPKCGLDLVEREGSKPVCTRIDCGGIILSNETLREWVLKEEPKQKQKELLIQMMQEDAELGLYDELITLSEKDAEVFFNEIQKPSKPNKALVEAAERYSEEYFNRDETSMRISKISYIDGAKEQAERGYSEEDLKQSYSQGWMTRERFDDLSPEIVYPDGLNYEEKQEYAFNLWFNQFKK